MTHIFPNICQKHNQNPIIIPNTNPNPNTPATNSMVTIKIAKYIKFPLPIPFIALQYIQLLVVFKTR